MGRLLRLLIQHKAIGISNQRPVICVEEHLVRKLWKPSKALVDRLQIQFFFISTSLY